MPATQNSTLFMVVCLALAAVMTVLGAIWARLRALPLAELMRAVDELATRQRDLEALLRRLEETSPRTASAGRSESGQSTRVASYRVDPAAPDAVSGPTLISVPNMAVPRLDGRTAPEVGEKFGPIWALADAGALPDAIAKKTGQPIGQVELILALRRQLVGAESLRTPGGSD